MLSAAHLSSMHRWTPQQRNAYGRVQTMLQSALCTPTSVQLRQPVGRTIWAAARLGLAPVAVGPGQFFVLSQFEVDDGGGIQHLRHELGRRIGSTTTDDGTGRAIRVQWWQETKAGSDVWEVRPSALRDDGSWGSDGDTDDDGDEAREIPEEYADVCVPVQVTQVEVHRRRGQRVIIWDDQTVGGIRGSTPRAVVQVAVAQCARRVEAFWQGRAVQEDLTVCSECGRRDNVTLCADCGGWHHPDCLRCLIEPQNSRSAWTCIVRDSGVRSALAAGDGSVLSGGSVEASAAWGLATPGGQAWGRLFVHWRDITSTRCEVHALIEGLRASGDDGVQVCDNKAAIMILARARRIHNGTEGAFIPFSYRHRVELRTLVSLMQPGGTFRAVWVRSHEEHLAADDATLTAQRAALAMADHLAGTAHQTDTAVTTTAPLSWDIAHVVDDAGKPVVGSTRQFISARARVSRRRAWLTHQEMRGEHRQTVCDGAVNMSELLHWDDHQRRFYWRCIGHVLHTNAVKHRLQPEWNPACRLCPAAARDTQAHRFGIDEPRCEAAGELDDRVANRIEVVLHSQWIPDQELFLPGRGHELASATNRPTRQLWIGTRTAPSPWRPMISAAGDAWAHALQLDCIVRDTNGIDYATHLLRTEHARTRYAPAGRLLPRQLVCAVRECCPQAAHYDGHPSQACDVWDLGVMHPIYPADYRLLWVQPPPVQHQWWWLDDTTVPSAADWWDAPRNAALAATASRTTTWIACYEDSPIYKGAAARRAVWYIRIPAGDLVMHSTKSVFQTGQPPRTNPLSRNPRAIWIGVVGPGATYEEHHHYSTVWLTNLQRNYSPTWLQHEQMERPTPPPLYRWATLGWAFNPDSAEPNLPASTTWLRRSFPKIYHGPIGWRTWPTATRELLSWASAVSMTNKEAKRLVAAVLSAIWDELRAHWSRTCAATVAAIENGGERVDWDRANTDIRTARQQHDKAVHALDTAIEQHSATLASRARTWHDRRSRALADTIRFDDHHIPEARAVAEAATRQHADDAPQANTLPHDAPHASQGQSTAATTSA